MHPLWGWMWIFGSEMTSGKRKVGARREEVLLSSSISIVVGPLGGSCSSPESSDEAESRRGGGSLSPRAIARVGGGGVFLHHEVSVPVSLEKTRNYRQFGLVLEAQKQVLESSMVERGEVAVK